MVTPKRDTSTLGIAVITAGGALSAAFGAVQATNGHNVWASPWFDLGIAGMTGGLSLILWKWVFPPAGDKPEARARLAQQQRATSTFLNTRIGRLDGHVTSTAESVFDASEVNRISGVVDHRPESVFSSDAEEPPEKKETQG